MDACWMLRVSFGRLLAWSLVCVFSLLCCGVSERSQPVVATPTGVLVTPVRCDVVCRPIDTRWGVPVGRSPSTGAAAGTTTAYSCSLYR